MIRSKKGLVLAASVLAAITAVTVAQEGVGSKGDVTIPISGSLEWLEKSDVSALKEGVIKEIEHQVGKRVGAGKHIGSLRSELAELTVAKAKLVSDNTGEIEKAKAQKLLALSELAKIVRLERMGQKGIVSQSEKEKAEAELSVAIALLQVATETREVSKADLDLAKQALKDHEITSPFEGVITDQMKYPGEAVRANEPVIRIGRTDKLLFLGWLPLEVANKLKGNEVVELKPSIADADLPIEKRSFKGRITALSREVNSVKTTEVRVRIEVDNPPQSDAQLELLVGMNAEGLIRLGSAAQKVATNKNP